MIFYVYWTNFERYFASGTYLKHKILVTDSYGKGFAKARRKCMNIESWLNGYHIFIDAFA